MDYVDPKKLLVGTNIVQFDPSLGTVSDPVSIPLLSDNIAEGKEYFGLTFAFPDPLPFRIQPVTSVLVAIRDTNSECR